MSWLTKIGGYAVRGLKILPDFLLGTGSETVGAGIKAAKGGSIWTKVKSGGKALEAEIAAAKAAGKGGFFARTWSSFKTLPKDLKSAGGFMNGLKVLGKRMPGIGALLTIAFEAPNIIGAFKDGGLKGGLKEILGAGVELGGMAAGAAIGSAFCPPIGTIVGGLLGALGGSLIRGKTHTQKKQEAKKQAAQQEQLQAIEQLKAMGLTEDDIAKAIQSGKSPTELLSALKQAPSIYAQNPADATSVTQTQPTSAYTTQPMATPQTSYQSPLTSPFMPMSSFNPSVNNYSNDIFYQKLFGQASGTYPGQLNNPYLYQQQQLGYIA